MSARRLMAVLVLGGAVYGGGALAQVAAPASSASAAEATVEAVEAEATLNPADPWEPFNRAVFRFNQDLDAGLLYPWADAYVTLVPELIRIGVHNFFNNFQDLWSGFNNLLQGKFEQSIAMTFRFAWNTVFGWGGLIDMATMLGIERTPEDFGQTLGVWGVPTGNFLMLPLFGPSTVRDTAALPLDIAATPAYAINQGSFRPVTTVVEIIDARAQLLGAGQLLDTIALDKYSFVRDAYLARRQRLVFDGDPPPDDAEKKPPASPPAK